MKNLILAALLLVTASFVPSAPALAAEGTILRVVAIETSDAAAYAAELKKGRALITQVDPKFKLRAWQATFAGDNTGRIVVAVEYPGDLAAFGGAWTRLLSNEAVGKWLGGLSGMRKIVSDSLYQEIAL